MDKKNNSYEKPILCDLVITENCMLKCKMCNMWQSKNDSNVLPVETWKGFIDSLADFVGDDARIQFVGGEPLLKNGILGLIRHAAKKRFSTTMTSNGYLLDKDMAMGLIDSGLGTLVLSLDSTKRETCDFLRGREGAYDRVMGAISFFDRFNSSMPRLHIVATIMQPNLDDILELTEWANRSRIISKISFQAVMQPFFTPFDNMWHKKEEFSFLWPKDSRKTSNILDALDDLKKKGYKITNPISQFKVFDSYFKEPEKFVKTSRCNLGHDSVTVNTQGQIFLCNSMDPIGSILEKVDFKDLWFSEKADKVRSDIRDCKHNCKLMINCFFEEEHVSGVATNLEGSK